MARYLLSSGIVTSDIITYVKDLIILQLKTPKYSIPHSDFGTDKIITSIIKSKVEESTRKIIEDIIAYINQKVPSVKLSISSIEVVGNTTSVTLSLNGTLINYKLGA